MQKASFEQQASVEDIIFSENRNLDKNMFGRLITLQFIEQKENLIITGSSGVGKSYLSEATCRQASLRGYSANLYVRQGS